jgi:uncharacterized protein (TIGR02266 family)
MAEERRSAPRARISGVRVTYEGATGDHIATEALNLGRGGLFVLTAKPLAVGKRLNLEIQVVGEVAPWSALGRVVWTRLQDEGERSPPGMGVKLIDVEDAVVAAIELLVVGREHTEPGVGQVVPVPTRIVSVGPSRERTILGVGSTARDTDPPAAREPSVPPERSIAIDLVARETAAAPRQRTPYDDDASTASPRSQHVSDDLRPATTYDASPASDRPSDVKRRGGGRWIVVLVLLAIAALATYVLLGGDMDRVLHPSDPAAAPTNLPVPPVVAPPPPTAAPPPVASTPPAPPAAAAPAPTATASATASSSAFGAPRKPPGATQAPPLWHPQAGKRPSSEDNNPY